jgi:hypothetical protein
MGWLGHESEFLQRRELGKIYGSALRGGWMESGAASFTGPEAMYSMGGFGSGSSQKEKYIFG